MRIIDANACIGHDFVKHEIVNHESFVILDNVQTVGNAEEMLGIMDKFGIEKACVFHRAQYDYDPRKGNKILSGAIKGHTDRLIPVWAILPEITDKEFESDKFIASMKENDVRLLKAWPLKNRYIMCDVTMGEQLDLYSELKIPIYLEPQPDYQYIYDVLKEFPKLTVIICNKGIWPCGRLIYPLLKKYPNVYLESGDLGLTHDYEIICEEFGPHKLIYGSNFPSNAVGCSLNCLMNATFSDEVREMVAHGNIERLMKEVRI